MLDRLAHMRVTGDAKAGQQADAQTWRLAEVMAAAKADGDDTAHVLLLLCWIEANR
jgi:hypothetical protein